MTQQGRTPFDDASGQQLIDFLNDRGGVGSTIHTYVAAGTTITNATETTLGSVYVTDTPANSGIKLCDSVPVGNEVLVYNGDPAVTLKVYPPTATQQIDDNAVGVAVTVALLTPKTFTRMSNTLWIISGTN